MWIFGVYVVKPLAITILVRCLGWTYKSYYARVIWFWRSVYDFVFVFGLAVRATDEKDHGIHW